MRNKVIINWVSNGILRWKRLWKKDSKTGKDEDEDDFLWKTAADCKFLS